MTEDRLALDSDIPKKNNHMDSCSKLTESSVEDIHFANDSSCCLEWVSDSKDNPSKEDIAKDTEPKHPPQKANGTHTNKANGANYLHKADQKNKHPNNNQKKAGKQV